MRVWEALLRRPQAAFSQPPFWSLPTSSFSGGFGERERIANDFDGFVEGAFKASGVIMTCVVIRQFVLSEARFRFQRMQDNGRPGEFFGTRDLALLERPWPGGTTGELIGRMEQDASLAGQFFATPVGQGTNRRLRRLRPDWVTIVTGVPVEELTGPEERPSPYDIRAKVLAYVYQPPGGEPTILDPSDVVHYSPIPDPQAQWRGMSWVTAIVREVDADRSATKHKLKYFENNASSGLIISYDPSVRRDQVKGFAEQFSDQYEGLDKAYRTIHVGGGADPKMVGANLQQLDFKVTQGAGESRMAAASLVGAVVAQLSEGMDGSALNAGNFKAAARRFADIGARPLWRMMAASLETIVPPPGSATRLWYDDRDIAFLRDDQKDVAEIQSKQAVALRAIADAGGDWDAAVRWLQSDDLGQLVGSHSGLFSVQLQPPGTTSDQAAVTVNDSTKAIELISAGWKVKERAA